MCVCVCVCVCVFNRKGAPVAEEDGVEGEGQQRSCPGGRRRWLDLMGKLEMQPQTCPAVQNLHSFLLPGRHLFSASLALVLSFQEEN